MQPRSLLPQIVQLTGLAAHQGYISLYGGYTDDSARKMPLKELYQKIIDQVFETISQSSPVNAQENRLIIQAVNLNVKALSKRYESRTTLLGRILMPSGMNTIRTFNRLIRITECADKILLRISLNRPEVLQLDDLSDAFDGLIGDDWERNAVLMEQIGQKEGVRAIHEQEMVDWTTKRSANWFKSFNFTAQNISEDTAWKVMPHLDFYQFNQSELNLFLKKYLKPKGPARLQRWESLSIVLQKVGMAMIENGEPIKGRPLVIEGRLMQKCRNDALIKKTVQNLLSESFPQNVLRDDHFLQLVLLFNAGLLSNERMPEGFDLDHALLGPLNAASAPPIDDTLYKMKAAVFVLRQLALEGIDDDEQACRLYEAFCGLEGKIRQMWNSERNIEIKYLKPLFTIYCWYCSTSQESKQELLAMYPDLVRFFNNNEPLRSRLFDAFVLSHEQIDFTFEDACRLIDAAYVEICFPDLPPKQALEALMHSSERGNELLREHFPYAYGFRDQAIGHLNDRLDLLPTAPLDLKMALRRPVREKNVADCTFDELVLMAADGRAIDHLDLNAELIRWLPRTALPIHRALNFSGRRFVDDRWLSTLNVPKGCRELNVTDTSVSPEAVFEWMRKNPHVKVIYSDRITPGQKLMAMNLGDYELRCGANVKRIHEPLLRGVSDRDPQLESDEVAPFWEYCYTRHISNLTIMMSVQLLKKAHQQGWRGIGEYCLAHLISSTNYDNLLRCWNLVKDDPLFAPYRYFCARMSLNGWITGQFDNHTLHQKEALKEISMRIFQERTEIPKPPVFQPVDLRSVLPADRIVIGGDQKEVRMNLTMMSLHSLYFERLFRFGGQEVTSNSPMRLLGYGEGGGETITSVSLHHISQFVHSGELSKDLNHYPTVLQLCFAAHFLEMPALKMVLVSWIRSQSFEIAGFNRRILYKLAFFALGYNPRAMEHHLIPLMKAADYFQMSQMEKQFAADLGIPNVLIEAIIQFSQTKSLPDQLTLVQLKELFEWAIKLNLTDLTGCVVKVMQDNNNRGWK